MPRKGHEERQLTSAELEKMIERLDESIHPELASVLRTHRMIVDEGKPVRLSNDMWDEIDQLVGGSFIEWDIQLVEPDDAAKERAALERQAATIEREKAEIEVARLEGLLEEVEELRKEVAEAQVEADKELDEKGKPLCECGCGLYTGGGRFKPGHDAKLKGQLLREKYYGLEHVTYDGAFRTESDPSDELEQRGWMHFYEAFARNEAKRERRAGGVKCVICNRPLTDEESVAAGIGPVCSGKH